MRDTVLSGTARWVGRLYPDLPLAGKTGTAQNPHGKDHSWFVGFFPWNNPMFVVGAIIEHGGSGASSAAPACAKVAMAIYKKYIVEQHLRD